MFALHQSSMLGRVSTLARRRGALSSGLRRIETRHHHVLHAVHLLRVHHGHLHHSGHLLSHLRILASSLGLLWLVLLRQHSVVGKNLLLHHELHAHHLELLVGRHGLRILGSLAFGTLSRLLELHRHHHLLHGAHHLLGIHHGLLLHALHEHLLLIGLLLRCRHLAMLNRRCYGFFLDFLGAGLIRSRICIEYSF